MSESDEDAAYEASLLADGDDELAAYESVLNGGKVVLQVASDSDVKPLLHLSSDVKPPTQDNLKALSTVSSSLSALAESFSSIDLKGSSSTHSSREKGGAAALAAPTSTISTNLSAAAKSFITSAAPISITSLSAAATSTPSALPVPPSHLLPAVIVLCGLPGAGKSSFYNLLKERVCVSTTTTSGTRYLERVSQDDLGSRVACEEAVRKALERGAAVVVDRCNFDVKQRSTWIAAARRGGVSTMLIHLNLPRAECERRAMARIGHPTVSQSAAKGVIAMMQANWVSPRKEEGYKLMVTTDGGQKSIGAALDAAAAFLIKG